MMMSAGPYGGPPLPVMIVAPRITSVSYGPAAIAVSRVGVGFIWAYAVLASSPSTTVINVFMHFPLLASSIDAARPAR